MVAIEFDDQSNQQLVTDTLNLTANQHMSVRHHTKYQALAGKKGIFGSTRESSGVTVLGLLSNATNAVTTIIPITQ